MACTKKMSFSQPLNTVRFSMYSFLFAASSFSRRATSSSVDTAGSSYCDEGNVVKLATENPPRDIIF